MNVEKWKVYVRDFDDEVVHSIDCKSERDAERVEAGLLINLNHDEYYTEVVNAGDYVNG